MAPIASWCGGTMISPVSRTSLKALTIPWLKATPPWNTTGVRISLPRPTLLR